MITFVTWKWHRGERQQWRRNYDSNHVITLHRMLKANLTIPFKLICVTDDPEGLDNRVEVVPLWKPLGTSPRGAKPDCYRRLYAFSKEAEKLFGKRFVSIDLDLVILKNIDHLFSGGEDFKIMRGWAAPYNGSMWMMNAGARSCVWDDFDPLTSPQIANAQLKPNGKPYTGSDQAWISYKIPGEAMWDEADGCYQYTNILGGIPKDACIIFFAGYDKPWLPHMEQKQRDLYNLYFDYAKRFPRCAVCQQEVEPGEYLCEQHKPKF